MAILTLALGIGANAAIFAAINAIVFRPLPAERPKELVSLNVVGQSSIPTLSYPNYQDFRDRNTSLAGLTAYRFAPVNMSREGSNARVWGYLVSANYFDVLGVKAIQGRTLSPSDDGQLGASPIIVISYGCWQRRFNADPAVTGKTVKINGLDFTIVGVAPQGFSGSELFFSAEFFAPVSMQQAIEQNTSQKERAAFNFFVVGRLKPGVTAAQAEANLNSVAAALAREYPKEDGGMRIALSPPGLAGNLLRGPVIGFAAALMCVAGLVLLIACANLASMLLARASDRRKEISIRLALGARRSRLIRQLLTEGLLLGVAGGAVGLVIALWVADLFTAWRPPVDFALSMNLVVDGRVFAFTLCVCLATVVLFALAPALQSTRGELTSGLKNEAGSGPLRRWQLRDGLVATQIALSMFMLIAALLVVRSLQHATTLNLGFNPHGAASVAFDLGLQGYNDERALLFQRQLLSRISGLPGIESAALTSIVPLSLDRSSDRVYPEGQAEPKVADQPLALHYRVSPGYFHTMQTRLLDGREFDDRDRDGSKSVAIVNEAFARVVMKDVNAVGRRFRRSFGSSWIEIVGVAEDGKYLSLGESPQPAMFRPLQQARSTSTALVVRSAMGTGPLLDTMRHTIAELDPGLPVYEATSLDEHLKVPMFPAQVAASAVSTFGALTIVLVATGLYGVIAYAVARRTREIGIRIAIGARREHVLGLLLRKMAVLLGAGIASGVIAALALTRYLAPLLYGVSPRNPTAYAAAIVLMVAVAAIACWLPARRAMNIDPVLALREE